MTPVRLERDSDLAIATIDHPPLNLFDSALIESLVEQIAAVEGDPPRALLFRAEGSIVSGGVDVHEFDGRSGQEGSELWGRLLEITHRVEALPFPTVFAAHALCLTAAFELSLACDILLAAESARFGLVEAVVGLTPAMGGTQRLAERAGPARAREFVMTGQLYDAATMASWNVVNRVKPDEGFDTWAREFAQRLANGPTQAHAATKQIVRAFLSGGVAEADAVTPQVAGRLFETDDLKAAVRSFLDEGPGKATFAGR
jgi:enoyl-CoA hydratase/carnithine racemase